MGLLPLEFTDCLQDSPYFRDSLHSHEKELERTSNSIKELIKDVKTLLHAAKTLSNAQRKLSQTLVNFKFECIGNNQTEDELVIANSLKEFGKLIAAIEDEKDRLLDRAFDQFIVPLENFRKEHIGAVKERKKKFEKQTAKFCASQERYLGLSTKKQDTVLQEADASLELERRDFVRAGLEYVYLIQEVQERKKFEFVETLLGFMYSWLTFYHHGHEVAKDFKPHMTELQSRIQNTREHFNSSREDIQALMRKMLEVRKSKTMDPGTLNKMFTRSGYLYLMEKKALTTSWNKYYCHYQKEGRLFFMIFYNQANGKMMSTHTTESFRIKTCTRRITDSIEKRFCFDLTPIDRPGTTYTFQATSENDLNLWLDAMDGKEPMYVHAPKPSNANQTFLDESGFNFITRCFSTLENRGLEDQGLYRVVGVSSKVTKLLSTGLDRKKSEKMSFDDPMEWESKTITSAAKTFLRNLPEPLMTFKMHSSFINAAKMETYEDRVNEVARLVDQLPEPNKRMLEILCAHLEKVALKSKKNMMTPANLGVCFGPTLLRNEEETVAAIMDIKFGNVVVEILIENWRQILRGEPPSSRKRLSMDSHPPPLTVLPISPNQMTKSPPARLVSPPSRGPPPYPHIAPPPYPHPPPPPGTVHNNGPKVMTRSPPGASSSSSGPLQMSPSAAASQNSSYNSATWERTLRMNSSASLVVPPPLGSAPTTMSPQHGHHKPVRASLSSLSGSQQHIEQPQSMSMSPAQVGQSNNHQAEEWYRGNNKISTAKTLQLQRQLSTGASAASSTAGSMTPTRSSSEDFMRPHHHHPPPPPPPGHPPAPKPQVAPRTFKANLRPSSSSGSSESLSSTSSPDLNSETANILNEAAATSAASQAIMAEAAAKFGLEHKGTTSSSSSSTTSSRHRDTSGGSEERRVRTLYACVGEHESELSFEPNQLITDVRPSLEPGWLEGNLDGRRGLVPENYVEFIN